MPCLCQHWSRQCRHCTHRPPNTSHPPAMLAGEAALEGARQALELAQQQAGVIPPLGLLLLLLLRLLLCLLLLLLLTLVQVCWTPPLAQPEPAQQPLPLPALLLWLHSAGTIGLLCCCTLSQVHVTAPLLASTAARQLGAPSPPAACGAPAAAGGFCLCSHPWVRPAVLLEAAGTPPCFVEQQVLLPAMHAGARGATSPAASQLPCLHTVAVLVRGRLVPGYRYTALQLLVGSRSQRADLAGLQSCLCAGCALRCCCAHRGLQPRGWCEPQPPRWAGAPGVQGPRPAGPLLCPRWGAPVAPQGWPWGHGRSAALEPAQAPPVSDEAVRPGADVDSAA